MKKGQRQRQYLVEGVGAINGCPSATEAGCALDVMDVVSNGGECGEWDKGGGVKKE
jgi:hypothetical protein